MNTYKSFAVTVTGGSHIKHGKGCEDSSGCYNNAGSSLVSLAVVADGHGDDNCFRSAKGAELAVECAIEGMRDFIEDHKTKFHSYWFYENLLKQRSEEGSSTRKLENLVEGWKNAANERSLKGTGKEPAQGRIFTIDEFEENLKERLIKYLIESWNKKVMDDYEVNPFKDEELDNVDEKHCKMFVNNNDKVQTSLITAVGQDNSISKAYGATLIAAAIANFYWFGIHIGDGRLTALYQDGSFDQPVPWDEKCYLNVTTSICDSDAVQRVRFYYSFHAEKEPPVAVFLCSDGIDDNYPVEENEKHLFKLYRTIALTFAEDGFEKTCEQLKDLATQFATKGKGDDTSIAGFIHMENLKKAVPVWQKQIAEEEGLGEKAATEEVKAASEQEAGKPENVKTAKEEENTTKGTTSWTPI